MKRRLADLRSSGYCVIPEAFDGRALARIRRLIDGAVPARARSDGWGVAVEPLLERVPEMARYFEVAEVVALLGAALEDDVRLVHTAARVTSLGGEERLPWHFHEYEGADGRWDPARASVKERFTRLLATVYVDGSSRAAGVLTVFPRSLGESTAPPQPDPAAPWPGQVDVMAPPGSIIVQDVALYHAARRGTAGVARRIFGGVYQRRSDDGRAPEDSPPPGEGLARRLRRLPLVRGLLAS